MNTANVHQAKTHLSKLLDASERGEDVIITRRGPGVTEFRLVPVLAHPRQRLFGVLAGQVVFFADFDGVDDRAAVRRADRPLTGAAATGHQCAAVAAGRGSSAGRPGALGRRGGRGRRRLGASLWEITIKVSLGRLGPLPALADVLRDGGITRLGIEDDHLTRLQELPWPHRDPFDRLLIAQALAEGLTVLTADPMFARYDVRVRDARG